MPTMNNRSFAKVMSILDISTIQMSKELYVSQSLVSRWKSGSRALKAGSSQYYNVLDYFMKVNDGYGIGILQNFFCTDKEKKLDYFNDGLMLRKALNGYLLSHADEGRKEKTTFFTDEGGKTFKSYKGMDARIDVQERFWGYLYSLDRKPDVYIKDMNYGKWSHDPVKWVYNHHKYCVEYMNKGGHIYYFSDLNIIEKADYYSSWEFSSHKNLHPTYYKTILSIKVWWSYWVAKDHISLSYFTPEDNPESYYTAVHQDEETLEAHFNYLKNEYDQHNKQMVINTEDKFNFAMQICQIYKDDVNPVFFVGKFPPFIFLKADGLRDLLVRNKIPKKKIATCMNLYNFINKEILNNRKLKKQVFFYKEDVELSEERLIDRELSAIFNKPIFLMYEDKMKRLKNIEEIYSNRMRFNIEIHIVSKNNKYVYSSLREVLSDVCVKYNKWCYTFDEKEDDEVSLKVIQDPTACSLRYEMFEEILKKK